MDTVRRHFRPELLNRLDDIVIFRPLDSRGLRSIVRLQMDSLVKRLKERDMYGAALTPPPPRSSASLSRAIALFARASPSPPLSVSAPSLSHTIIAP
jgi:hypothetical protein